MATTYLLKPIEGTMQGQEPFLDHDSGLEGGWGTGVEESALPAVYGEFDTAQGLQSMDSFDQVTAPSCAALFSWLCEDLQAKPVLKCTPTI